MRKELKKQIVPPILHFSYTLRILQHKADKLPKLFSLLFLMLTAFRSSLSSNNLSARASPVSWLNKYSS